jgi:predicted XRE-type DNA-binding protein
MTRKREPDSEVTRSSGNVFRDLNLPHSEHELTKVALAAAITDVILRKKLTQAEAGKRMGLDQPKVSALVRGHLDQFSVDRLFTMLVMLGLDVDIKIRAKPKNRPGRITVATVAAA